MQRSAPGGLRCLAPTAMLLSPPSQRRTETNCLQPECCSNQQGGEGVGVGLVVEESGGGNQAGVGGWGKGLLLLLLLLAELCSLQICVNQ